MQNDAISAMNSATVKYANRQIKWLKNRLLPQCEALKIPVIVLDVPVSVNNLLIEVLLHFVMP